MYVLVQNNKITQFISHPKSIVIGDVRYPAQIFTKWSKAEKEKIGLYLVHIDKSNYKDPEYYNNSNAITNFINNKAIQSWKEAKPKNLEDENIVDENGDPILDKYGVQLIKYGLKTEHKKIVKQQAASLLAPTDWYVVKSTEVADYDIPANILSFRADVRNKSNEMEAMIDACTTVDELKSLYEYTNTGTEENPVMTRPLPEFPKEI